MMTSLAHPKCRSRTNRNPDHVKRHNTPTINNEVISQHKLQKLLEQLDKSYPSNTTAGKMAIATEAIEYIDSNQTLAQRVLSALKAGGIQALAQLLNHPAASFVIGALEDWQKSKES